MPTQWWQSLHDTQLDNLIEEALGNNFTIRSAWDRLAQTEQIAVKTGADLLPQIDYKGTAERKRQETAGIKTYSSNYTTSLVLSYEIDLWGKIRSSQQAAIMDAEAAKQDIATAEITLTSNIAKTWYQLAELKEKDAVLNRQINTNRKVLDIITTRFRQGLTGASDVYRQKQLVEATQGKIIQNHENIVLLQHKLSVLLGRPPSIYWLDDSITLIDLPPFPQTGIPSSVIQRRPDVISEYKTIQAADMRVAAAIADQYPTISISSTAETSADRVSDLFDDWLANLAGNAIGPLFDADLRKAELKRTQAVLSQAINDYAQAILEAIKETENAVNQEKYQLKYLNNLRTQLVLSRQVYKRTKQSYIKGQLDYLRVLDALSSQQNLEINVLNARRFLIERRIDLYKAIAGSWDMKRPEPAKINK